MVSHSLTHTNDVNYEPVDDSIKKLSDQIVKTYPALKKAKKEFIFGYKVSQSVSQIDR